MDKCQHIIDAIVHEIAVNNQINWYFNIKISGGFLYNLDNPKIKALKNVVAYDLSNIEFVICCYSCYGEKRKSHSVEFDVAGVPLL